MTNLEIIDALKSKTNNDLQKILEAITTQITKVNHPHWSTIATTLLDLVNPCPDNIYSNIPRDAANALHLFNTALSIAQDTRNELEGILEETCDLSYSEIEAAEDNCCWCFGFDDTKLLNIIESTYDPEK